LGMQQKYDFKRVYVDPSAADWFQKAKNKKIPVVDGNNDIDMGIAKIKSIFSNDLMFIDKKCEFFLKEMESYQYDKDRIMSNKTEKPIKKNDHAMDALRYAFTDWNPWHKKRLLSSGKWG